MADPMAAQAGGGMVGLLLTAFLLGVLHGVTPDEHTWPITMSYAIGAASGRRGLQAGLLFSAAFAIQRALASELAFLALAPILASGSLNAAIDLGVGLVMAVSGVYILRRGRELHLTEGLERYLHRLMGVAEHDEADGTLMVDGRPVPLKMTLVHGFVAGWGTGAFAIIIYTKIAPAMPNAAVAWLPGLLFGLGTMVVQAAAGAAIGAWMRSRGLGGRPWPTSGVPSPETRSSTGASSSRPGASSASSSPGQPERSTRGCRRASRSRTSTASTPASCSWP